MAVAVVEVGHVAVLVGDGLVAMEVRVRLLDRAVVRVLV
jgi:hypothetical protein